MRALMLLNPEATNVSPRVRDVIASALSAEVKLDVAETDARGHATELAARAVAEDFDLIVCLGGDGTLNETINAMAGTRVPLAPLPGGGTNVFARAMGAPRDPIEATGVLLERIRSGATPLRINLGRVNGRYFSSSCGIGFDAAVVREVERKIRLRKRLGDWLFVSTALRVFFLRGGRGGPPAVTIERPGAEPERLHLAVVCNTNPYTFLGARPLQLCPQADPHEGLDVMGLRTMRTIPVLATVIRAFGSGAHNTRRVYAEHSLKSLQIRTEHPTPCQLDGDYVGEDSLFRIDSVADALSLLV